MIIIVRGYSSEVALFWSYFKGSWILGTDFRKNIQISNFVKIPPVEADFFHVDTERDRQRDGRTQACRS